MNQEKAAKKGGLFGINTLKCLQLVGTIGPEAVMIRLKNQGSEDYYGSALPSSKEVKDNEKV